MVTVSNTTTPHSRHTRNYIINAYRYPAIRKNGIVSSMITTPRPTCTMYLGYYDVTSKLRCFIPGPIQGISYISGGLLPNHALSPAIYICRYFISSSQLQRPGAGRHRSRVSALAPNSSILTSRAYRLWSLPARRCRTLALDSSIFSHHGGCTPDRVIWLATLFHRGLRGEIIRIGSAVVQSKVSVRRTELPVLFDCLL
jgi:hypothetical protein